tara:strand:- start:26905 stop:27822 length:918 start_codon:yes stop_codon:yes gene_type:complete
MTSSEIAWRLLRHCEPQDPTALTLSQASELMGSLSFAMSEFFRYAPAKMRRTSASAILEAPITKTGLAVVNNATGVTSGNPFTTAQRGATVALSGDPILNEVVSTTGWLNAYQGITGTKTATIYGDCIAIQSRLMEKLVSDPWIHLEGGGSTPLRRARNEQAMNGAGMSEWWDWRDSLKTGRPTQYAIQSAGISRGSDAYFLLRVSPMPEVRTIIRFEADVAPDSFDHTNVFQVPVDLPLSEDQIESMIIPLCEKRLLTSTLYKGMDSGLKAEIRAAGADAKDLIDYLPQDHAQQGGKVRRKRGW